MSGRDEEREDVPVLTRWSRRMTAFGFCFGVREGGSRGLCVTVGGLAGGGWRAGRKGVERGGGEEARA